MTKLPKISDLLFYITVQLTALLSCLSFNLYDTVICTKHTANEDICQDQSKQKLVLIIFLRSFVQRAICNLLCMRSFVLILFITNPVTTPCSKWKIKLLFKDRDITAYSMFKKKSRCKSNRDALICGQLWTSLLLHLFVRALFPRSYVRYSWKRTSNVAIARVSRNLKSYQVIQHTQLNLLQSSNAISLLIAAWRTRGCPQLVASCDTLTRKTATVIVFQPQLR